jgi:hypothetical protein
MDDPSAAAPPASDVRAVLILARGWRRSEGPGEAWRQADSIQPSGWIA